MAQANTTSFQTRSERGFKCLLNPLTGKTEKFKMKDFNSKSIAECDRKMQQRKHEILQLAESRLGRPPTVTEFMTGRAEVKDDRTNLEQQRDSDWRPAVKHANSPLENMLEDIDKQIEVERIKSLSPLERQRHDIEQMIDRENQEALEAKQQAAHLEKIAPKLAVLDKLIEAENWNPQASERLRAQLRKAKSQLLEPDGDGVVLKELFQDIDLTLIQRREAEQAALEQQAVDIGRQIAEHQAATESLESLAGGEDVSLSE